MFRFAKRYGWLAVLLLAPVALAQQISATPRHADGRYAVDETIQWHITAVPAGGVTQVHYVLRQNGAAPLREGNLDLGGAPVVLETILHEPGTVLAELTARAGGKQLKLLAGAAVAPDKIPPSTPRPADFEAFWKSQVAALEAVPEHALVEPAPSGLAGVHYEKVTLDNIHGTHVYGQLARPERPGKLPARLIVQWAGVYGLPRENVTRPAQQGWLTLNIMAHDLPLDRPAEFYKQMADTTLKNYTSIGNDDRTTSYFLRMILGCWRAADYLAHRPEWDGQTLVVTGTSQGGLQGIATAALYPKISAVLVNVPAGCDTTGPLAGRSVSWPYWYRSTEGKDAKKVLETSRYFDAVNFASLVHCPALVALGLIDETSRPAGVFAAANQMTGPTEVVVMINSNHHGDHNAQAPWQQRSAAWFQALAEHKPVPAGG